MRGRSQAVNPRILGYLGRALSMELSAVQQYMTQASLVESWGMTAAGASFREEVVEELHHADRIVARMLALGVAPNASQLRPVQAGRSLIELLGHDHRMEQEIIQLYHDASLYCARIGDREHQHFFEELLGEEREHAAELQRWMEKLGGTDAQGSPAAAY